MSNIDEIQEYLNCSANTTALRINPNEVHQILRLYIEISSNDVKKLKF